MSEAVIAVLEDTRGRVERMRAARVGYPLRVFASASEFLDWWRARSEQVVLVSLDYHLGPPQAGKGLQVALALAAEAPLCPVIVHTSDSQGARAMADPLEEAGWTVAQAVFELTDWGSLATRLLSS